MPESTMCNRCGKKLDLFDRQQNFSIHIILGYGSVHDGDELHYNLCCDCIDETITECVVDPIRER